MFAFTIYISSTFSKPRQAKLSRYYQVIYFLKCTITFNNIFQVQVFIQDIPSACVGSGASDKFDFCNFQWTEEATPIVTDLPTDRLSNGDTVTITGKRFINYFTLSLKYLYGFCILYNTVSIDFGQFIKLCFYRSNLGKEKSNHLIYFS